MNKANLESLPMASANPRDQGKVEEEFLFSQLARWLSALCWLCWVMDGGLVSGSARPEQLVTSTRLTGLRDLFKITIDTNLKSPFLWSSALFLKVITFLHQYKYMCDSLPSYKAMCNLHYFSSLSHFTYLHLVNWWWSKDKAVLPDISRATSPGDTTSSSSMCPNWQ